MFEFLAKRRNVIIGSMLVLLALGIIGTILIATGIAIIVISALMAVKRIQLNAECL